MASRVGYFLWKCRMWKILCLAHPIFFFFFRKKIDIQSLLGMCVYVTELKGRKCFILKPGCHWLLLTKWARVFHANGMNHLFDSVRLSSTMFFWMLPGWRKRDVGKKLAAFDVTCTRPRALQTFLWKAQRWQSAAWEENQRPPPSLECLMGIWIGLWSVECSAAYCQSGFYVWCLYIFYKRTNVLKHHDGKVFLHFFCACVVYIGQQNKEAAEAWGQTKLEQIGVIVAEPLLEPPCVHTPFAVAVCCLASYSHCSPSLQICDSSTLLVALLI